MYAGRPVSNPSKSRNASPTCSPSGPNLNSRIMRSCGLARLLMTARAERSSPLASKNSEQQNDVAEVTQVNFGLYVSKNPMLTQDKHCCDAPLVQIAEEFMHLETEVLLFGLSWPPSPCRASISH